VSVAFLLLELGQILCFNYLAYLAYHLFVIRHPQTT